MVEHTRVERLKKAAKASFKYFLPILSFFFEGRLKFLWARAWLALRLSVRRHEAHASRGFGNGRRLGVGEAPACAPLA